MAWRIKGRATEHSGAKHGSGAYRGQKRRAKYASTKERRRVDRCEEQTHEQ